MDVIRSCYRVPMRFYQEQPNTTAMVQWYFVPQSNGTVDFPNSFFSKTWDVEEEVEPELGETFAGRVWSNGQPPYPVTPGGLCGNARQWHFGSVPTDPIVANWPGTAVPMCCSMPPLVGFGGTAIGSHTIELPCCADDELPEVVFVGFQRQLSFCPDLDDVVVPLFADRGTCPAASPDPYAYASPPFSVGGVPIRVVLWCDLLSGSFFLNLVTADCGNNLMGPVPSITVPCMPPQWQGFTSSGFAIGACVGLYYYWTVSA
jgi:hypothetical protein